MCFTELNICLKCVFAEWVHMQLHSHSHTHARCIKCDTSRVSCGTWVAPCVSQDYPRLAGNEWSHIHSLTHTSPHTFKVHNRFPYCEICWLFFYIFLLQEERARKHQAEDPVFSEFKYFGAAKTIVIYTIIYIYERFWHSGAKLEDNANKFKLGHSQDVNQKKSFC